MERNSEYYKKTSSIYMNGGGFVWVIERGDTHEFLEQISQMYISSEPETAFPSYRWNKEINLFTEIFLTEQDAKEELQFLPLREGGCPYCGNGSKPIPIIITEHEFVGLKNRQ